MFRFQHNEYLLLLLALPAVAFVFYKHRAWMLSIIKSLGGEERFRKLLHGFDEKKQVRRFGMLMAALALLVLGLANPQTSGQQKALKQDGLSVVLALDVSNSMMAEDVAPNRLERSRFFFKGLIEKLRGNRVGLVLFAGNADVEAPPSNDYKYTLNKLEAATVESIAFQGTGIAAALRAGRLALSNKPGAIVLVTDGEDHELDVAAEAVLLKEKGIYLMVFGIGTKDGAPIPDPNQGFKKDGSGNTVHSKINEAVLKQLAEASNGFAGILSNNQNALKTVIEKVSQIENGEIETVDSTSYNSYFQWLLFPAFLVLLLEWYWTKRR